MKIKFCRLILCVVILLLSVRSLSASFHEHFVVYFPQVAKGILADYSYETLLIFSNPENEAASVTLNSSSLTLFASSFQLAGGETRKILITSTGKLETGWIRVESTRKLAASAQILVKSYPGAGNIISEVTILGQPLSSKVVVQVFRNGDGSAGPTLAENTGIALAVAQTGLIQLSLRDDQGTVVATRALTATRIIYFAQFVTEFFPALPATFRSGSLTLEHLEPPGIPRALAVAALYTRGSQMWSGVVSPIDVPRTYFVSLKSTDDPRKLAQELAEQYGFTIFTFSISGPSLVWVFASEEVARAVARDPRVESVGPNTVIQISRRLEEAPLLSGLGRGRA